MRIIDCAQGTEEWHAARAGRATSSEFSSVMAKGQGKTRATYLRRIVAERVMGKPVHGKWNGDANTDRGHELEPLARSEYMVRTGRIVDQVGMILHDEIMASCSPDGLVGMDGGVEIKSVLPTTQVETIHAGGYPSEHKAQVQGNIWISERKWWDFASYCPEMPDHLQIYIFRVMPDLDYIKALENEVRLFLADVDAYIARLPKAPEPEVFHDPNPDEKIHHYPSEIEELMTFYGRFPA